MHTRPRFSNVVLAVALMLLAANAHASAIRTAPVPSNLAIKSVTGYAVYGLTDAISTVLQLTTLRPLEGAVELSDGRQFNLALTRPRSLHSRRSPARQTSALSG